MRPPSRPSSGSAGVMPPLVLAILLLLLPVSTYAGRHFFAQGPGYELKFNDRQIPRIPLAMDRDNLRAVENVFAAWVLGGNQAYARIQETQIEKGYAWFLCGASPHEGVEEFTWPADQEFIAVFKDGRSLAAVEVITHTSATWGRAPRANLLPIYPEGIRLLFSDFEATYPSGRSNTILIAFPADTWGSVERVTLRRNGKELTGVVQDDQP
ncbi:MAG: hypothetical protein KAY32_03070 [Candidatus Eisenbacteria sp.]|nr:hypothetical protein [Candidatus Eisenbacteria bacterium]